MQPAVQPRLAESGSLPFLEGLPTCDFPRGPAEAVEQIEKTSSASTRGRACWLRRVFGNLIFPLPPLLKKTYELLNPWTHRTLRNPTLLFKLVQIGLESPFPSLHSQLRNMYKQILKDGLVRPVNDPWSKTLWHKARTWPLSSSSLSAHSCKQPGVLAGVPPRLLRARRTLAGKVLPSSSSVSCSRWVPGRSCQALTARKNEREIGSDSEVRLVQGAFFLLSLGNKVGIMFFCQG